MNKKTIILITAILSFSLGQSLKLPSIASTDLQSTGRIIVTNPDTGNQEIIFDAQDQEKLKSSITANGSEILDLKSWKEQQLQINQELSDKDTELETKDAELEMEIELINESLASFQNGVDSIVAKCTACGSAPTENTPDAINTAIQSIYTDRYNLGYSRGDKKYNVGIKCAHNDEGIITIYITKDGTSVKTYQFDTSKYYANTIQTLSGTVSM